MNTWNIARTDALTLDLLVALLKNEIGAICISHFVADDVCEQIVQNIYNHGIDYYKDKYPRVGKIGITQSEHKYNPTQKKEYFDKVLKANREQSLLFKDTQNLLCDVIDAVMDAWRGDAGIAFEESLKQYYFAGLVRVINKASLHYDWAPLYDMGWETDRIAAQLTWNMYLQVGSSGGATKVYHRFGQKQDAKYILPAGYFNSEVVEGAEFIEIMPEQGELVFFNSQNYHEVYRTEGDKERITFSSFIGLLEESNKLLFWS